VAAFYTLNQKNHKNQKNLDWNQKIWFE